MLLKSIEININIQGKTIRLNAINVNLSLPQSIVTPACALSQTSEHRDSQTHR